MRFIASLVAAMLLAGCGLIVYKIDLQQGNYVTADVASKLRKGMTKSQVKQLLGTPLLSDVFHANRWDYYFSNVKSRKTEERTRMSVFFEDDKLVCVTGTIRPTAPGEPPAPATLSEAPAAPAPAAPGPAGQ